MSTLIVSIDPGLRNLGLAFGREHVDEKTEELTFELLDCFVVDTGLKKKPFHRKLLQSFNKIF